MDSCSEVFQVLRIKKCADPLNGSDPLTARERRGLGARPRDAAKKAPGPRTRHAPPRAAQGGDDAAAGEDAAARGPSQSPVKKKPGTTHKRDSVPPHPPVRVRVGLGHPLEPYHAAARGPSQSPVKKKTRSSAPQPGPGAGQGRDAAAAVEDAAARGVLQNPAEKKKKKTRRGTKSKNKSHGQRDAARRIQSRIVNDRLGEKHASDEPPRGDRLAS